MSGEPLSDQAADPAPHGRVLVVDDLEPNRLLLRDLLEVQRHVVFEAADGITALELVPQAHPDVVLLDVQMPGIDGFETCRRLKADPATAPIPVLLVTALNAREHRLAGIQAGANDFITKPLDIADLTLRVRNAVQMRQMFVRLEDQYRRLQELEELRDNLVHMMIHDLRSPLSALGWSLEVLQGPDVALKDEDAAVVDDALQMTRRLADMVSDVLDVSRMESGQMPLRREPVDLDELVRETIAAIRSAPVPIEHQPASRAPMVSADRAVLGRVVANLLDNAIKFNGRAHPIRVTVSVEAGQPSVSVRDSGPGIPAEARARIFEKFGQVEGATAQARRSSGLGLTFCKLAIEAHGGTIGMESAGETGSIFRFQLPAPD